MLGQDKMRLLSDPDLGLVVPVPQMTNSRLKALTVVVILSSLQQPPPLGVGPPLKAVDPRLVAGPP